MTNVSRIFNNIIIPIPISPPSQNLNQPKILGKFRYIDGVKLVLDCSQGEVGMGVRDIEKNAVRMFP